jgi:MoxR-like ATPase
MKSLKEFFDEEEKRTWRIMSPNGTFTMNQIERITKEWLEEYRKDIQEHDGDPDVKDWFYMAVDELKTFITSPVSVQLVKKLNTKTADNIL